MRKTLKITIEDRGVKKRFILTEMSATETFNWSAEMFFAMANAGIEVPEDVSAMGLEGIAQVGLQALGKIPYEKAKPLLDRLLDCVQVLPNPDNDQIVRKLVEEDIEDVATHFKLRKEVFNLHTDFLQAAKP
jgi:hypothetical protein